MILDDARGHPATAALGIRTTLDELLRRAAARRPDVTALIDPPDRASFTTGKPRRLTYAQADRIVSAIADRLRRMGLHTDAVVAIQIANTVESALTILGIMRAGLIAMPLPLLWRRAEAVAALSRVGPHALIVSGRVGQVDHYDLAMQVAAEIFPVRYVCGYGDPVPDGVVGFDDLFTSEARDLQPGLDAVRAGEPGAHVAAITWDVSADGLVPVARSHAELIAGGLAVLLEGRLPPDATLLSPLPLSSFGGLAIAMIPWLLLGGTLALHQPFDPETFRSQLANARIDAAIVPGPLAAQFVQGGLFSAAASDPTDRAVIGLWRAPEQLAHAPAWPRCAPRLIDVQVFGEAGLLAATRGSNGRPVAMPFGVVTAPRPTVAGAEGALAVVEIAPTPGGTLALRGPMVPRAAYPPGAEHSRLDCLKVSPDGYVDTGYACDPTREALVVTGPPAGIVGIGGYRFPRRTLEDLVAAVDNGTLAVLPDALAGQRLAGSASDPAAVRAALAKVGATPLLIEAFAAHPQAA